MDKDYRKNITSKKYYLLSRFISNFIYEIYFYNFDGERGEIRFLNLHLHIVDSIGMSV